MSEETEIKYPFSIEYQTRILAVILRDRDFTLKYRELIKPSYFDNNTYADVVSLVLKFCDENHVLPSRETISNKVKNYSNKGLIERLLDTVYSMDLTDSMDVEAELADFIQQQSWRLIQPRIDLAVKEKDFEKARLLFDSNMRINEALSHEKDEIFYFDNIEQSLLNLNPDKVRAKKIATLIAPIDNALGGGAGEGQLLILFAPRKTGKSIFLTNICVAALYQKKNVLFVSLELGEKQIEKRVHTRITGIVDTELYSNRKVASGRIKRLKSLQGNLVIKKYPYQGATVNVIRSYMDYLWQVCGFRVDILLVDYLDILAPVEKHMLRWQSQGPNAEYLRKLADEFAIPVWTVTQANASSEKKENMEGTDVKGDSVKIETADLVCSLLQTVEEQEVNKARLFMNYVRDGAGQGKVFPMHFDKSKMLLTELKS